MNADSQTGRMDSTAASQESTRDLVKLLISLSSGVVALSVTFVEKLAIGTRYSVVLLYATWFALVTSIFFGVDALSKLADAQQSGASTWSDVTFPPMRRSWFFFQVGVVLLVLYGGVAAWTQALNRGSP